MKLSEIKLLEEPVQTRTAEEVWQEGGTDAAQYITTAIYYVRPVKGEADKYEVLVDQNGTRKTYGVMDEEDLNASFAPMRANQKPDAEGFTTYRSADVYQAFKYGGDPIRLTIDKAPDGEEDGQTVKLSTGDYLLRQDDGTDFVYSVERANYFDNGYVKK